MPLFPIFTSSAKVGNRINTTLFHPNSIRNTKGRRKADVESTISVKDGWIAAIALQTFLISNNHRNSGTVFGGIKHLLALIILRIESNDQFVIKFRGALFYVVFVDTGRSDIICKGIVQYVLVLLSSKSSCGTY